LGARSSPLEVRATGIPPKLRAIEARDTLRKLSNRLTDRELQAVTGLGTGLTTAQIAEETEKNGRRITPDRQIQQQVRDKLRKTRLNC
jgi:hypothetical protein